MLVTRRLGKLGTVATRRLARLRVLVISEPSATADDHDAHAKRERTIAFVAIEAHNLWALFVRSFFLSCVIHCRHGSGHKVVVTHPSMGSVPDALRFAIGRMKSHLKGKPALLRRDEPAWHDPGVVLTLLREAKSSNLAQVDAAFGYRTRVFQDLTLCRHFYAHRNEDTEARAVQLARAYGMAPTRRVTDLLCSRAPSRPQTVLLDWLDDLRIVVELLCE